MTLRETDIGAAAKVWLEGRGFEVFSEVEFGPGRIDLVGRTKKQLVAVECKVGFGLDVIAQASRWLPYTNESWVAVAQPKRRGTRAGHALGFEICLERGIGVMFRGERGIDVVALSPTRDPKGVGQLHMALHPEQRDAAAAGTNGGGYSTGFKRTAAALTDYVAEHPGARLDEVVSEIKHHYRTRKDAISGLTTTLKAERDRPATLANVRMEGRGRKATLWPVDAGVF